MQALDFLPTFPLALGDLTWAGAILLVGLACGELFRRVLALTFGGEARAERPT